MLTKKDLPLIVGYLPYELKLRVETRKDFINRPVNIDITVWSIGDVGAIYSKRCNGRGVVTAEPILKPMVMFGVDDANKILDYAISKGINNCEALTSVLNQSKVLDYDQCVNIAMCSGAILPYLYANHYDIHGLIEQSKAVDWREIDEGK